MSWVRCIIRRLSFFLLVRVTLFLYCLVFFFCCLVVPNCNICQVLENQRYVFVIFYVLYTLTKFKNNLIYGFIFNIVVEIVV